VDGNGEPVTAPPCAADTAIIDEKDSVSFYTTLLDTHTRTIKVEGGQGSTCSELESMFFYDGSCQDLHIDDQTQCFPNSKVSACHCASSCPDAAMRAEQDAIQRKNALIVSEASETVLTVPYSFSQTFMFDLLSMLSMSEAEVTTWMMQYGLTYDSLFTMVATWFEDYLNTYLNIAGTNGAYLSMDYKTAGPIITIKVQGAASASYFIKESGYTNLHTLGTVDFPDLTYFANYINTQTATFFADTIVAAATTTYSQSTNRFPTGASCDAICANFTTYFTWLSDRVDAVIINDYVAYIAAAGNKTMPLDKFEFLYWYDLVHMTTGEGQTIQPPLTLEERNYITAVWTAISAEFIDSPADWAIYYSQYSAIFQEEWANKQLQAIFQPGGTYWSQVGSQLFQATFPTVILGTGYSRSPNDFPQMLNGANVGAFTAMLVAALNSIPGIAGVTADMIALNLLYTRLPGRSGAIVEGITIDFDYMMLCGATRDTCGFYDANSPIFALIQGRLNNIVNIFDIQPFHPCFDFPSGTFDNACLSAAAENVYTAARDAGKSPDEALAAATQFLRDLVGCGASGRDPVTGDCMQVDDTVDTLIPSLTKDAESVYESKQPAPPSTADKTKSEPKSDGLPIIPIAAGAGAFVLILIIIIIVVARRKKNREDAPRSKVKDTSRSVVAFENPMYDDPGQSAAPTFGKRPFAKRVLANP